MKIASTLLATVLAAGIWHSAVAEDKKPEAKAYPLDTCIVSGEKLGEHGKPYVFTHDGQEIKMCCKSCLKDFNRDTAKYLKKLEKPAKEKK